MSVQPATPQPLGLAAALVPVAALVGLLGLSYYLFGDTAASGPNQVALVFCSLLAIAVARWHGHTIDDLRDAAVASVTAGLPAIFILLSVGALIGTWALGGTLTAMVYYGLKLLNPDYFYPTTCLICLAVAMSIGSSWTVAGTLGIGLMGVAREMGLDPAITAGAVVSGAYFGDKLSPLSGTANLACAAAGSDLYEHFAESLRTSVPALLVALVMYWGLGTPVAFDPSGATAEMEASFHPSSVHFIPLALVLALAIMRRPPFVAIFLGALAGGVLAVADAPERVMAFAGEGLPYGMALLKGVWLALTSGYVSTTGDPALDQLLSRGGMASMLGTVWLILVALAFGGLIERAGVLERLIGPLIAAARSGGALVATLVGAAFGTNVLASDQYIAVVLPGRMFRPAFEKRGYAPVVLSRSLGDSAAVTSPLIPWNSCGAYMAATLGVATTAYLPYAFFNLLNPLVSITFAFLGLRMMRRVTPLPSPPRPARRPKNSEAKEPTCSRTGLTRTLSATALIALAAGAPALAQQASSADIDRMMAVIEAQQRQIDADAGRA